MTQEEKAKQEFIKRGFWPNEVMWKCWLDAWMLSAKTEPIAWLCKNEDGGFDVFTEKTCKDCFPVYTE